MSDLKQLADELQALQSTPPHGGELYADKLELLINATGAYEGLKAHEKFAEICNLADLAFPAGIPSEKEIQENPATQPLMVFLLAALRSYRLRTSQKNRNTTKRREILASCFGLDEGKHGGNTRGRDWNTTEKVELETTFAAALWQHRKAGLSDQKSWVKAFMTTYELAFGADTEGGRDSKQSMKNRIKLERLLSEHGYSAGRFEVNLKALVM